MTPDEAKSIILDALSRIAPEVDLTSIDATGDLRHQIDIDSMDFLTFVLSLHARLGVAVPEADYARLSTLDGAVAYVTAKLAEQAATTDHGSL